MRRCNPETTSAGQDGSQSQGFPDAANLASFLATFPELTGGDLEIADDMVRLPQKLERENSLDMSVTTSILGWDTPAPKWPQGEASDNPWSRGFFALCRSSQAQFHLLVVSCCEGVRDIFGPPEPSDYRLFAIGLQGELIESPWQ